MKAFVRHLSNADVKELYPKTNKCRERKIQ